MNRLPSKDESWDKVTRWAVLGGGAIWLVAIAVLRPNPFQWEWAVWLLLLSALVLVPMALGLTATPEQQGRHPLPWRAAVGLQPPAVLALLAAFALPGGIVAALLAVPWLAVTGLVAWFGLHRLLHRGIRPLEELSIDAGLVFLAVGGIWTVLSRLGARPLGFADVIVFLTAIHFHYAGLALPLLTGLAGRWMRSLTARLGAGGAIIGVPLVASGITATQLGFGSLLECAAAWITAIAGSLTACLHLQLAVQRGQPLLVRLLWMVTGLSLVWSMALAAIYGSRAYWNVAWLDIPWMRALHGSANGLGFALAGMLAWSLAKPALKS